jgi:hypothetical protein
MGSCHEQPLRILVKCSGPAYGACMDSYRAEAYGLLSLITFLHLLGITTKAHDHPPTFAVITHRHLVW